MERVGQAADHGLAAMVEMPALPGDDARMQRLLLDLDDQDFFWKTIKLFGRDVAPA